MQRPLQHTHTHARTHARTPHTNAPDSYTRGRKLEAQGRGFKAWWWGGRGPLKVYAIPHAWGTHARARHTRTHKARTNTNNSNSSAPVAAVPSTRSTTSPACVTRHMIRDTLAAAELQRTSSQARKNRPKFHKPRTPKSKPAASQGCAGRLKSGRCRDQ